VGKRGKDVKGERFFAEDLLNAKSLGGSAAWADGSPLFPSATIPLGIVSLLLTPQDPKRKILATFSDEFPVRKKRGPGRKKLCVVPAGADSTGARLNKGGKSAVLARLDRSMHQSGMRGARPLAARKRVRRRILQQL
jgi:hypothetical protein